ncbi:MAG: FHA domain-containing protein, partial [Planctomycetaceae bacterium]|nr:FHA domain-containing protein [Planctomycetaceae bacterium]
PVGGGDPIPLLSPKLLVGRRSSCDICLAFPNISSHHCQLELRDGYWHVQDLGSSNGIKVNGERCLSKCLSPGDELQIAKMRFRIDYQVSSTAAAPEEADPFATGLMEKAGLGTGPRGDVRMPAASGAANSTKSRNRRHQSSEDDFIMEWLSDA